MSKYPAFWRGFYTDLDQDQNDLVFHLEFTAFNILEEQGQKKIKAQGKDEHGNITIDGQIQDKQVTFLYKSPQRELLFKGEFQTDTTIMGMWGPNEMELGSGNFTLEKIEIKQGWNGYFVQEGIPSQMNIEKLTIEAVPNGKVTGSGNDWCGPFIIQGIFDTAHNEVSFSKTYTNGFNGEVTWAYWGTLNHQEVTGSWGFEKNAEMGQFKLTYYE